MKLQVGREGSRLHIYIYIYILSIEVELLWFEKTEIKERSREKK